MTSESDALRELLPEGWDMSPWGDTFICPDGHEIELDGECPDGHKSPLTELGLI